MAKRGAYPSTSFTNINERGAVEHDPPKLASVLPDTKGSDNNKRFSLTRGPHVHSAQQSGKMFSNPPCAVCGGFLFPHDLVWCCTCGAYAHDGCSINCASCEFDVCLRCVSVHRCTEGASNRHQSISRSDSSNSRSSSSGNDGGSSFYDSSYTLNTDIMEVIQPETSCNKLRDAPLEHPVLLTAGPPDFEGNREHMTQATSKSPCTIAGHFAALAVPVMTLLDYDNEHANQRYDGILKVVLAMVRFAPCRAMLCMVMASRYLAKQGEVFKDEQTCSPTASA